MHTSIKYYLVRHQPSIWCLFVYSGLLQLHYTEQPCNTADCERNKATKSEKLAA